MSSVLCGMFPLRTNSCHQRKHNVWQWMFSLYDSLIWNHYQRSSVLICLGSGGVGVCGAVRAVASDHLKKKLPCSQGGKAPLLTPATPLFSVPDCLVWLVSRMRYIRIHEKRKFNTKSIYPIQMEKSIDEWPPVPFRVSKCLKKESNKKTCGV